jgi:methyltransferase-like protein
VYPEDGAIPAADRESLANDLLALHDTGRVEFRTWQPAPITARPGAAPRVSALTRWEAERSAAVTNMLHKTIELSPFVRVLVRLLDGARERAALVDRMAAAFAQGELSIRREDGGEPTADEVREMLPELIENAVTRLAQQALLVGRG